MRKLFKTKVRYWKLDHLISKGRILRIRGKLNLAMIIIPFVFFIKLTITQFPKKIKVPRIKWKKLQAHFAVLLF